MQKYGLKFKIVTVCLLVVLLFVSCCAGVYYALRYSCAGELDRVLAVDASTGEGCAEVLSGVTELLKRSYLLSDEMLFKLVDKLDECQSAARTHANMLTAAITSLFTGYELGDEELIANSGILLADCCVMLDSSGDAETLYYQILRRDIDDPGIRAKTYAAAQLGLSKLCAQSGRAQEALEHLEACLAYAESAGLDEFESYAQIISVELSYDAGEYDRCAQLLDTLSLGMPEETAQCASKLSLPLLSYKALIHAQQGDFPSALGLTRSLIRMSDSFGLDIVKIKHLEELEAVYESRALPLPEELEHELLEGYKCIAGNNTDFITEYALLQYLYFFNESGLFKSNLLIIALVILLPSLLLLQYVVRLIVRSQTDALTGLLNRSRFTRDCRRAARRRGKSAFIMFDVDDFKQINDTFGHTVGDVVLSRVAKTMYRRCNRHCRVYRMGGEEFAIIISSTRRCPPYELAEDVRSAVEALRWREEGLSVTLSAGISTGSADDLYHEADRMLYYSKAHGKNRIT